MTANNATSIQVIRGAAGMGASRRPLAAGRGVETLARVCRGLFGGPAGMRPPTAGPILGDTVEILISRARRSPLAPAA